MRNPGKFTHHIVVLDADPAILEYVRRILVDRFSVSLFTRAAELIRSLRGFPEPDLLLIDWHTAEDESEQNALGLLARTRALKPTLPIIMVACSAEPSDIVAATRMGATSVILKPFTKNEINLAVQQHLKLPCAQPVDPDIEGIRLNENTFFVRSSKRMREIESQCALVARANIPVLILGESGTGKEIAAMLIHKGSARSQRCFLKVNCAAMPADLLESELFGYEQGAFTGAVKSKPGKFETCNGGTILLDEIGEMPPALQAKLLQVLQDGSFSRLGSRTNVQVDVRVIAATNIDIKAAIAQKTFREDLYYRLNGFTLKMPPLRERTEEIPILAQHFMRKISSKFERVPLPISRALLQALSSHTWPGNLRELENTIKRYFVLGDEQAIIDELDPLQSTAMFAINTENTGGYPNLKRIVKSLKGNAEAAAIARSLDDTGWNRRATASDLQISYKALLYKIKEYNLSPPRKVPGLIRETASFDQAQRA